MTLNCVLCIYSALILFKNEVQLGEDKNDSDVKQQVKDFYMQQPVWCSFVYFVLLPFLLIATSLISFLVSYHWIRVAGSNSTTYESIKNSYKFYKSHPVRSLRSFDKRSVCFFIKNISLRLRTSQKFRGKLFDPYALCDIGDKENEGVTFKKFLIEEQTNEVVQSMPANRTASDMEFENSLQNKSNDPHEYNLETKSP